jgi:hypothetical protein
MSKKITLLFLFLTYALVLVHSVMPHEHLHQEVSAAKQHSHDKHSHNHAHHEDTAKDIESPFSHYFHSLAQGEPHFPGKANVLIVKASKEATVEEQIFNFNPIVYNTVRSSAVYETDFHSPPDTHHFSRRGPPLA